MFLYLILVESTAIDEVTIAVAVPVVIITVILLVVLMQYVDRRMKRSTASQSTVKGEENQPYLQTKAELDPTQQRLELSVEDARPEVQGESAMSELPNSRVSGPLVSLAMRHELRGEEHSKELEAS